MKKLLLNLLILVFSSYTYAAEVIVHNGKEGIFIEKEKAEKLVESVEMVKVLDTQVKLLELKIKVLEEFLDMKEKRIKNYESTVETWKESYTTLLKDYSEQKMKDDFKFYVYVGLFTGGSILGAATMYGSSVLLNNIK